MNSEEIKRTVSMRDVLNRYGIEVRNNMCKCPFHGKDRHPSMKIFRDGYNCFACGVHGDIFGFVQEMEHCSFKDAYIILGGTYEKVNDAQNVLLKRKHEQARKQVENKRRTNEELISELNKVRHLLWDLEFEPMTDEWIYQKNKQPYIEAAFEELTINNGKGVDAIEIIRVCDEIRQKFDSFR